MTDDDLIARFWAFFAEHAGELRAALDDPDADDAILHALRREVSWLSGSLRWEVGPHSETERFFAFGLAGSLDRLALTRRLVAAAPGLPGWVFLPSRPAKTWERRLFHVEDVTVDFDAWRFAFADAVLAFEATAEDERALDEDDLEAAAWFLAESELGEERALRTIDDVVRRPCPEGASAAELAMLVPRESDPRR